MPAPGDEPEGSAPGAPLDQPGSRRGMAHVPALDGLRGLAVVAVLLFHAGYLTGGWLGVDLFFVLSGYLITSLLLYEHRDEGRIDLPAFWGRRARRLLPALGLVLVAVAAYAWIELLPIDLGRVRSDGLATLFFVANWHDVLAGRGYWDRTLAPSLLGHTWSLAVEEQLYLVWPLGLTLLLGRVRRHKGRSRRRRRAPDLVARAALVVAACSAGLAIWLHLAGASNERIYLGTDTRAVAVALGAFVAGWRRRKGAGRRSTVAKVEAAGIVAAVALGGLWWWLDGSWSLTYRGGLLAASALAAVVVAAAADPRSRRLAVPLSFPPLRYLGLISYGLYLWHWPLYEVLDARRTGLHGPALLALRLGASVAAASASWWLVERPIRARRPTGWWSGRAGLSAAVGGVALVAVALVGATLGAVSLPTEDLASGVVRPAAPLAGAPEVVVLGDSVAASVAAPAIKDPKAYGLNVVRSTVLGCQAVWDGVHQARGIEGDVSTPPACPAGVAGLVGAERPDAVLVLYGGWTDADLKVDGAWVDACSPAYTALLRTRFTQLLAEARISGAPVYVANTPRSTNTFRADDSWGHTDCTNAVMQDVASRTSGVGVIDLDRWLCPNEKCRQRVDGVPVRSDGVHFQGPGGTMVSQWLFGVVAKRAGLDRPALIDTSQQTAEYRATLTVCQSFGELDAISGSGLADIVATADSRKHFAESLARLNPTTLSDLDPTLAAQLTPLTDPTFQTWAVHSVDLLAQGQLPRAADLPAGTLDAVGSAMEALRKVC